MRRKVKAGLIEADHEECAIVVHYEVEATVLGELGEPIVAERQENTKRIKLKTLSDNTNIPRLAEEILEKCKLIHASKLSQVEQLLYDLVKGKSRQERGGGGKKTSKAGKKSEKTTTNADGSTGNSEETPSLQNLDRYIEGMYDDPETATQATYMILQLARSPENLEALLENEALLGLLARLLQEEGPKSMDLAINILYILYSFSNFSQFHPVLYQARVGNYVLQVIELEAKRYRVREHERQKQRQAGGDPSEEKEKEKRHRLMLRKQEKLLYVCFHVLLNLAEEPDIERKMAKRGIVGMLTSMLSRSNAELLVLVLLFLMKLAIFKENLPALREKSKDANPKDKQALPALITALQTFVPHQTEPLVATALRLLFNLSFDAQLRGAIVSPNANFLPKLASLLKRKQQLPLVLRLLYNVSAEEEARVAIGATDTPRVVMKHVLACNEAQLPLELAALAINLASEPKAATAMADNDGGAAVRTLVDRLYQSHDLHVLKLVRNLALHKNVAAHLLPFAADLIALAQQVDAPELLVELLGILGTLPLDELAELPDLADKYNLVEFLARFLVPGFTADDVLLEVIICFGQLASHPQCAPRLSQSRVLQALYSIITDKQEDDEIVLQILFCFFHLLQAAEPRFALLQQTQLVVYLLDLLMDKNPAVRKMADLCLDVVMELDETWAPQIRQRKFQMHNKEWLEVVDEDEAEEYQDAVALNNAMASLHSQPLDAGALDGADDADDIGGYAPEMPIGYGTGAGLYGGYGDGGAIDLGEPDDAGPYGGPGVVGGYGGRNAGADPYADSVGGYGYGGSAYGSAGYAGAPTDEYSGRYGTYADEATDDYASAPAYSGYGNSMGGGRQQQMASFADGEYGFDDLASPGADSAGDFGGGGLRGAGGGFGGRVGGDEDEDEFDDEDGYGRRGELYDPASAPSGWGSRT